MFSIELIAARLLLPRYGGAAWVWGAAMTLYQLLLLAGYLYVAAALGRFGAARYGRWHLALLASAALVFPLALPAVDGGGPVAGLLRALLAGIGLPFFALATTSPVVQALLESAGVQDEYRVYAHSNAGALLALAAYPLLIEPRWALPAQLRAWQWAYGAYAVCHLPLLAGLRPPEPALSAPRISARDGLRWTALALGPGAALLAATNLLMLDLAAVPLLWAVPLAVYLSTFVLNFKREPWLPRPLGRWLIGAMAAWTAIVIVTLRYSVDLADRFYVIRRFWTLNKFLFVNGGLFLLCLLAHRALAESRPPGRRAPAFYACIALGGWLGSAWIAWLMPWLGRRVAVPELDWALAGAATVAVLLWNSGLRSPPGAAPARPAARWTFAALAVAALAFYVTQSAAFSAQTVHARRTLYGFYRVTEAAGRRSFLHGNVAHGAQWLGGAAELEPRLYYHRASPLGDAFAAFGARWRRVAVLGLGCGTLAAYGRPGQGFDFYELDPAVEEIARRHFTYLSRSRARVRVLEGDARVALGREAGRYDAIVVDAFSGGSIPIHLVTREALALYSARLAGKGLLLAHVSNRFLDLRPVLAALAADGGWSAVGKRVDRKDSPDEVRASWVALSRDAAAIAELRRRGWAELPRPSGVYSAPLWTDSYASVLSALK